MPTRPLRPKSETLQYIGETLEELVSVVGRLSREASTSWPKIELKIEGMDEALGTLGRIEQLLIQIATNSTGRLDLMADTLDDVRTNLQELGVDVDTAVTEIVNTRQQLIDALNNAGVDQAARDEIMGLIDAQQAKIVSALNPAVELPPVEEIPPAEFPPEVTP